MTKAVHPCSDDKATAAILLHSIHRVRVIKDTNTNESTAFAMVREQSEEAQWWFQAVYSAIQEIPLGKVTSYSQIAHLLGFPKRARQVGVCLKHLPTYNPAEPEKFFFHDQNVPWQRVVNAKGGISPRGDDGLGASRQARKLSEEGVEVNQARGIEELSVDLGRYGWFPKRLPSEADEEDSDESEGG